MPVRRKDSIGKRYRRQDAIGTPYCVTVDHQTLEDNCVTLRNRDTMQQERGYLRTEQYYCRPRKHHIAAENVAINRLWNGLVREQTEIVNNKIVNEKKVPLFCLPAVAGGCFYLL